MTGRLAKIAICLCLGLFAAVITYDNIVDYGTNYDFVRHVLSMDTTPPDHAERGRAITSPAVWQAAYALIIACEGLMAALFLVGAAKLWAARRESSVRFQAAKGWAQAAGTLAFVLYFLGFMTVGGEWFAMWRSETWNGQEATFRFLMILLGALIFISQEDG